MENDSFRTTCIPLLGDWMQMEKGLSIHSIQLEVMRGNNAVQAELLLLSSCPSLIIRYLSPYLLRTGVAHKPNRSISRISICRMENHIQ